MEHARRGASRCPPHLPVRSAASRAANRDSSSYLLQGLTNGPAPAGLFHASITYNPTSKLRGDTRRCKRPPGTRLPPRFQAAFNRHHSAPQRHARRHLTPRFSPLPYEHHRPRRASLSHSQNPRPSHLSESAHSATARHMQPFAAHALVQVPAALCVPLSGLSLPLSAFALVGALLRVRLVPGARCVILDRGRPPFPVSRREPEILRKARAGNPKARPRGQTPRKARAENPKTSLS